VATADEVLILIICVSSFVFTLFLNNSEKLVAAIVMKLAEKFPNSSGVPFLQNLRHYAKKCIIECVIWADNL